MLEPNNGKSSPANKTDMYFLAGEYDVICTD
jgi:hypothetical protein